MGARVLFCVRKGSRVRPSTIILLSAPSVWVCSVLERLFFWPVVAILEFGVVLNTNSISKGCSDLPASGLWWSKPEHQRCYNKALKNNEIILLEILLMLLITLHSTHRVVRAKRDFRPSHASAKQGLDPRFMTPSPLHSFSNRKGGHI